MTTRTRTLHHDAGHAWLCVDCSELDELGIAGAITGYSYAKGPHVYLEEDCDLGTYMAALRLKGVALNIREQHDGDDSPIRRYPHYTPPAHSDPTGPRDRSGGIGFSIRSIRDSG